MVLGHTGSLSVLWSLSLGARNTSTCSTIFATLLCYYALSSTSESSHWSKHENDEVAFEPRDSFMCAICRRDVMPRSAYSNRVYRSLLSKVNQSRTFLFHRPVYIKYYCAVRFVFSSCLVSLSLVPWSCRFLPRLHGH